MFVVDEFVFVEEECDFVFVCVFVFVVGVVDDVLVEVEIVVVVDGVGGGFCGVCFVYYVVDLLCCVLFFLDYCEDGIGCDEVDEIFEEGFVFVFVVVVVGEFFVDLYEFVGDYFEIVVFEVGDDVFDEVVLDVVGFDYYEGVFCVGYLVVFCFVVCVVVGFCLFEVVGFVVEEVVFFGF